MLITPRPGTDRGNILRALKEAHLAAENLFGAGPFTAYERLLAYLEWSTRAVHGLRYMISSADIDRLILTPRHATLLNGVGHLAGSDQQRLVNGLIDVELTDCIESLGAAVTVLEKTISRWSSVAYFVVADSSFYVQHTAKLADADLHAALGLPAAENIHLMFPMVVVDELDDLKEAGKQQPRWRATHTLGLLDSVLGDHGTGTLRQRTEPADPAGIRGAVTVEVVFDQPGHTRLPIADDEIIDRALAIQALASRAVHLLTCDTGQATRGRTAGLKVRKLSAEDLGDEPDWAAQRAAQDRAGTGTRAKRRVRQEAGAAEREANTAHGPEV